MACRAVYEVEVGVRVEEQPAVVRVAAEKEVVAPVRQEWVAEIVYQVADRLAVERWAGPVSVPFSRL